MFVDEMVRMFLLEKTCFRIDATNIYLLTVLFSTIYW